VYVWSLVCGREREERRAERTPEKETGGKKSKREKERGKPRERERERERGRKGRGRGRGARCDEESRSGCGGNSGKTGAPQIRPRISELERAESVGGGSGSGGGGGGGGGGGRDKEQRKQRDGKRNGERRRDEGTGNVCTAEIAGATGRSVQEEERYSVPAGGRPRSEAQRCGRSRERMCRKKKKEIEQEEKEKRDGRGSLFAPSSQ
jgi:hypothetical protein